MYEILTVYVDEETGKLGIEIEDKIAEQFENQEDLLKFLDGGTIIKEVQRLMNECSMRVLGK